MKNQKNSRQTNRKSIWHFLLAVMALCAALSLLCDLATLVAQWMGGISFAVRDAATIGIIGGADGPTAIFVTSSTVPVWQTILKSLVLGVCLLGWCHLRKRK